jgi:hypothetical protein
MNPLFCVLFLAEAAPLEPMHPVGVGMVALAGAFSVLGAWRNWDWFFAYPPAPIFVALLGRKGARVFYILLGIALMVGGVLGGLGVI